MTFFVGDHTYDLDEGVEKRVQALDIIMHPEYDEYDYYYYYYYDNEGSGSDDPYRFSSKYFNEKVLIKHF